MTTVWITGCAGFLGTRLARALRREGLYVVGLSRRHCPLVHQTVSLDLSSREAPALVGDLLRCKPPDVVIHAAARQPGEYQLVEYVLSNVVTTAVLVDSLRKMPPHQLIYTSSLNVYRQPATLPVHESSLTEGDSPYSVTKLAAERIVKLAQSWTHVCIFRLPSLYGTGQADSFIDGLMRLVRGNKAVEVFSSGNLVRDALHVEDVVGAIVNLVKQPSYNRFACYNLGCGRPITTREYVEALVKIANSTSPIIPVDRASPQRFDLYADISRARRELGFSPTPMLSSLQRYLDELRTPA